jgi:hypothetical protein
LNIENSPNRTDRAALEDAQPNNPMMDWSEVGLPETSNADNKQGRVTSNAGNKQRRQQAQGNMQLR